MLVNLWLIGMSVLAFVNALRALQLSRRLNQVRECYWEAANECRFWMDSYYELASDDQEVTCHE